ncbi:sterol desaturase family protein [Paralimibaculum aggregatum]|uniref:Sterol desaturase family protein n=1 Tax=Paralimibaculum aggregatum TaxID=3036245 RepID=A0ABQ6LGC1_9RHOB|nr:sterol desaturase family protein [Limibaculum sp. NKW23]GMG82368.1 sterol desaturase family protein [Limibaculum sp. NKW23]
MSETAIRLGVFFGLFALLAAWELARPRRRAAMPRAGRWLTNWAVSALDAVMVRLVFGAAAVGAALDAAATGTGLFHALAWPGWLEGLMAFVLFDLAIWAQHVASHHIGLLWRLHRVHHSDRDMDVTTAIRFHPLEIALSMALKIGLVYALGAPAIAVVAFEIVLNGAAMFNHGNIRLPARVDRLLRLAIVTPDMHRVHHSTIRAEHDSNFGFNLSLWDRLFGTYRAAPAAGHEGMTIGLPEYQSAAPTRLLWTLALPFRRR